MSGWVKTADRQPEECQLVLMWGGSYGDIRIGSIESDLDSESFWTDQEFYRCDQPTHWHPLPEEPEESA